ncbi:uncharacterized protein LOC130647074 [Hydractinia symbiolongicarpus]|uniref:uncharacterized protein LOC130647074 n=1 Tax=Hydractinia symbiolongicarpus TaxID=13093 RepID=UPI00254BAD91|nr:uncharacterized protein LOC130647074 [Hydractinia symbiolongicarpus]
MKAFMDDIFLMSTSIPSTKSLLKGCTTALDWVGMSFRPSKSRSIVIDKGKVVQSSPFTVGSEKIPSIHSNPIRFLGRTINSSLSDSAAIQEFLNDAEDKLITIDRSFHKGIHKVWFLHHLLIPRIRWPLLIYEVSPSTITKPEQRFSVFIRKWLKLHHSISNISLYSSTSPCPLPLKSLASVLKSAKINGHMLLRDSGDPCVSKCVPDLKAGVGKLVRQFFRRIVSSISKGFYVCIRLVELA